MGGMDSFFGMNSKYSGRVSSRKRKRKLPYALDQQEDCIVCFDGDDFVLCDRRGCPNPYHPSCVKRDNNLLNAKENFNCDTGEDKISDMPDSLLHHILSFLPMEDAVSTSILSKRWRSLWFSQPILNFDDEPFLEPSNFFNFVYSFMTMRDITLPIVSFHLKCCNGIFKKDIYNYNENIYNFVYIAIQQRVENLYIDFSYSIITLPSFVLSTKTLSALKLTKMKLNDIPYVHLPSLKVLHLEHVTFTYYEYILKLLSGCPILQDLGTNNLHVRSSSPYLERPLKSLSKLVTANICNTHIEFDWLHNVERLRAMVLMEKFPYTFHRIAMFHNLTHMELIINSQDFPRMLKFNCLIKLLDYCPKLQSLIIDEDTMLNKLWEEDWEEPRIVSKCLLSHLTTCSLRNYKGMNCELHFTKYIMMNSRVLSAMTIQSSKFVDADTKLQMSRKLSLCPKNSPTCKLLFI